MASLLCTMISIQKYMNQLFKMQHLEKAKTVGLPFARILQLFNNYKATHSTMHSQLKLLPFQIVFISNTTNLYEWRGGWWVSAQLSNFQGEMAKNMALLFSKCHTIQLNPQIMYTMNNLGGNFSKVAACTSQPLGFNGRQSTYGHLRNLRSKPQKMQTSQCFVIALL